MNDAFYIFHTYRIGHYWDSVAEVPFAELDAFYMGVDGGECMQWFETMVHLPAITVECYIN